MSTKKTRRNPVGIIGSQSDHLPEGVKVHWHGPSFRRVAAAINRIDIARDHDALGAAYQSALRIVRRIEAKERPGENLIDGALFSKIGGSYVQRYKELGPTEEDILTERLAAERKAQAAKAKAEREAKAARAAARKRANPAARKAAPRRNPHPSMTEQQASDTITALGGMGKLRAMIGADTFIRGYEADGTPSLSFKFKGCKTANYARIALDPSDTYTLRLFKIRGYEAKPVYEASNLYAENLRPAFERATGLYLSLGTMRGNPGKGAAKRPVARKVGRRNPHSIHPYVVFEEWRATGFPKKHIALLSAASGVDEKEMERHFGAKGYVYDPESEDGDTLFNEVENGIVDRYGMPTAAEYAEGRAALKAGGAKAPARSSVKKAPKGPPPLSKFKHHPYLDFSSWESSDYKDQSYLKAISLASGVPLKTLQEGSFGYGAKDDALAARIEGIIVDRYGSPWTDNPRKGAMSRAASRKVARRNPAAGVKATIYFTGAMGDIKSVDGTVTRVASPGGIFFIKKGGRRENMIMTYYSPFIMAVKGWGHPKPPSAWRETVDTSTPGVTMRQGKYRSADPRWESDFMGAVGDRLKPIVLFRDGTLVHSDLPVETAK